MTYPKALRTNISRLLGPHTILYKGLGPLKAFGLGFRVKGLDSPEHESVHSSYVPLQDRPTSFGNWTMYQATMKRKTLNRKVNLKP